MKFLNILLVEDDIFTSRLMKTYFESKGLIVHQAFDIGVAYNKAVNVEPSLVILDLSLPSGFSLDHFQELKRLCQCPILIYTSKGREDIELRSFETGADDFVLKERGIKVLYSRMKKYLNDNIPEQKPNSLIRGRDNEVTINDVVVFKDGNQFRYKEKVIKLTKIESNILYYLAINKDNIVTRDELSFLTKGYSYDGWTRSMDLSIYRLRKKLDDSLKGIVSIETVRGKGYRLTES